MTKRIIIPSMLFCFLYCSFGSYAQDLFIGQTSGNMWLNGFTPSFKSAKEINYEEQPVPSKYNYCKIVPYFDANNRPEHIILSVFASSSSSTTLKARATYFYYSSGNKFPDSSVNYQIDTSGAKVAKTGKTEYYARNKHSDYDSSVDYYWQGGKINKYGISSYTLRNLGTNDTLLSDTFFQSHKYYKVYKYKNSRLSQIDLYDSLSKWHYSSKALLSYNSKGNINHYRIVRMFQNGVEDSFGISFDNSGILTDIENAPDLSSKVNLYPNPVKDKLYLDLPHDLTISKIVIYNLSGKCVMSLNNTFDALNGIEVHSLHSGMYILQIYSQKSIETMKFIKE